MGIKENIKMSSNDQQDLLAIAEYEMVTLEIEYENLCDELHTRQLEEVVRQLRRENMELKLENALLEKFCTNNNLS